jgi:superfamily I DNA/RNA helicase
MEPVKVWSPQQKAVFEWIREGRGSAFVEAVAGAGKTTTLVEACGLMEGSVAFAAYNKKIADEIKVKLGGAGIGENRVRAGTFHSFGWSAWRRSHKHVKLDDHKIDTILDEFQVPRVFDSFVPKLVSLAKQAAMGLLCDPNNPQSWWRIVEHHDLASDLEDPELAQEGIRQAYRVLKRSRDMAHEVCDFDDMIYMPVITECKVWQNDWVLVDEAQDTNPARRALARKMLRPRGRAIFVGDPHQAIYGFTGADADAVQQISKEFNCRSLPLTTTYRCPKAVVAAAQEVVSHIQAHGTAPEGDVSTIPEDVLMAQGLVSTDAILCRKTAPLVSLAFKLIRAGVACHVEGREIGAGLLKLARRWKVKSVPKLLERLDAYLEREIEKLTAKGQETKAEAVKDRVETLKALADGCPDLDCVQKKIETMFQDNAPTLTLSTVHKSKGREWPRVFVLGRNVWMPSPWARQTWQVEQENNLIYVAYTRAMRSLVLVDVKGA